MAKKDFSSKKDSGGGGAPGWMVTFSDLMSLLLTFFILLYSMSNVDDEKFDNVSQSLQGALGGIGLLDNQQVIISKNQDGSLDVETTDAEVDTELEAMKKKVTAYIEEKGLTNEVEVNMDEKGIYFDIKDAVLFDSGSAELTEGGRGILDKFSGLIADIKNDIVIEGHTDNVPINNHNYANNWELSTARAISVVKYFTEVHQVVPGRMSAVGYGEYKPMVDNNSPENKAINRRVNILIIFDEGEALDHGK